MNKFLVVLSLAVVAVAAASDVDLYQDDYTAPAYGLGYGSGYGLGYANGYGLGYRSGYGLGYGRSYGYSNGFGLGYGSYGYGNAGYGFGYGRHSYGYAAPYSGLSAVQTKVGGSGFGYYVRQEQQGDDPGHGHSFWRSSLYVSEDGDPAWEWSGLSARQRRAPWLPGHPFQGQPLEGTYLDPSRRRGADESRHDRHAESYRDEHEERRVKPRRRRPVEEHRSRYDTFQRAGYSRARVEPYAEDELEHAGAFDGHHHASRENGGYPRDHAARHVYGDGHRAGDPYNIRPTDEQVERGYAEEEEHDRYYGSQLFPAEDEGDEEEEGKRRGAAGAGRRRPRPQYEDYEDGGRAEDDGRRRGGSRRRHKAISVEDYDEDYPEYYDDEYVEEDAEVRVPVLEDHEDFRPERRPAARSSSIPLPSSSPKTSDNTYDQKNDYSRNDRYATNVYYTPKDRYTVKGRYAAKDYYPSKDRLPSNEELRYVRSEQDEAYGAGRDYRSEEHPRQRPERGNRGEGYDRYDVRAPEDPSYRRLQKRAALSESSNDDDLGRVLDTGERGSEVPPATEDQAEVQVDEIVDWPRKARGLKGARYRWTPSTGALERIESVRRRRQAATRSASIQERLPALGRSVIEVASLPLGGSEKEYPRNPHNPANFVDIPEFGSEEEEAPNSLEDDTKKIQKQASGAEYDQYDSRYRDGDDDLSSESAPDQHGDERHRHHKPLSSYREEHDEADYQERPGYNRKDYDENQNPRWESTKWNRRAPDTDRPEDGGIEWARQRRPAHLLRLPYAGGASDRTPKTDAFGRRRSHAEFGNHFPSPANTDAAFERRESDYISDASIPTWGPGYDSSAERYARAAPTATNERHQERVRINESQKQQELIAAEESRRREEARRQQEEDDRRGGYQQNPSLGSRRPGGVPDGRYSDSGSRYAEDRYPYDEGRRHGDGRRVHDDDRRTGGRRYGDDDRRRPEAERRPPPSEDSSEVTGYYRQPPQPPRRPRPEHHDEDRGDSGRRRYPAGEQEVDDGRRYRGERRPDEGRRDDARRYYDERRPEGDGPDGERRYNDDRNVHDDGRDDGGRYGDDERRPGDSRRGDERRYDEERHQKDDRRSYGDRYHASRHPDDDQRGYVDSDDERDDDRRYPERRPGEDEDRRYPERRPGEDEERCTRSPGERPSYYREPDSRHPDSAEDAGEGGYYREPHPDQIQHDRFYRQPESGGRYYADDERREGEDSREAPQEGEDELYTPNQSYYDGGAPGYYGDDGPGFTRKDNSEEYRGGAEQGGGAYRGEPDQKSADAQVSGFIRQMFNDNDPFRGDRAQ
ncbi:trichohyalin-like [Pollicipes pollicipes]|uniref:trichohyalin-like n=1 Tax=Pollicipes pollicipes TaxID=41117 RepID=UPI0018859C8D|nr:trichohyalin-like [Pollicipes pollicipes]